MKTKYKKATYELLDRTSHNIYSVKEFKSIEPIWIELEQKEFNFFRSQLRLDLR